jgi:rubrerythrin
MEVTRKNCPLREDGSEALTRVDLSGPSAVEWLEWRRHYSMSAPRIPEPTYICNVCGERMREIHCKIVCPRCGYTRDCSDP